MVIDDFEFDDIMECPDLLPGDAILIRGDTFHRTQDADTDRVSLSLRMVRSDRTLTKAKWESSKATIIAAFPDKVEELLKSSTQVAIMDTVFAMKEEWTLAEILAEMQKRKRCRNNTT